MSPTPLAIRSPHMLNVLTGTPEIAYHSSANEHVGSESHVVSTSDEYSRA
jgi:hypothetical protein